MNSTIRKQAQDLRKMINGFQASRVILTANNLHLFNHLTSPKTADECARVLGTDVRATGILLDALTGLGLLRKSGVIYKNTGIANRLMVHDAPASMAGMVSHMDTLWKNWSALDEVVRTGLPARKARDHESFIRAMHSIAVLRADAVIDALVLKGVQRALDLGGGPGTYSIALAKRGIAVTLFDVPDTITISREIARASRVSIDFIGGNFLTDPIGTGYDLVFISQIFHSFSELDNRMIIGKCVNALNRGGTLAAQEFFINDARTAPAQSALFSINMLVNTEQGRCYSPREMKQWMLNAGFGSIKNKRIEETVLVSGKKK